MPFIVAMSTTIAYGTVPEGMDLDVLAAWMERIEEVDGVTDHDRCFYLVGAGGLMGSNIIVMLIVLMTTHNDDDDDDNDDDDIIMKIHVLIIDWFLMIWAYSGWLCLIAGCSLGNQA